MTDAADFLAPFLAALGVRCAVEEIAAAALPAAFRRLLDHDSGMTGTLAARWGGTVRVRRLAQWEEPAALSRLVVLRCAAAGPPVTAAVAAIRVSLAALPASVPAGMRAADTAFGRLLDEAGVRHRAEPLAFLRAAADGPLAAAAGVAAGAPLYGRYGRLRGDDGRELCRTVELLPRA
ncbi:hypothetical protein [Azospirillum sp. ST 5-10]|uniref:hypothetical protein n=1 Tax=unclassified Azospirillum TaxID=2630922 RepID=UPI003F49F314